MHIFLKITDIYHYIKVFRYNDEYKKNNKGRN